MAKRSFLLFLFALLLLPPIGPGQRSFAAGSEDGVHTLHGPLKVAWVGRYGSPVDDEAHSIAISPDGATVFVAGKTDYCYMTTTYDATSGSTRWTSREGYYSMGRARALALSPDGATAFVTGSIWTGWRSRLDYHTLAYRSATGYRIWQADYAHRPLYFNSDVATGIALSPDGSRIFVTGRSDDGISNADYATLAYDTSDGHQIWVRRYSSLGRYVDEPRSIAVSPDGETVFVTGRAGAWAGADFRTLAYDARTGYTRWAAWYDSGLIDDAAAITVSPSGRSIFVTGTSRGALTTSSDYATVAYDSLNGEELWTARYDGPASGCDEPVAIAASPDGVAVVVTGTSAGSGTGESDIATLAYDAANGALLWSSRYDGPASGADRAAALVMSRDGTTVVVAGASAGVGTGTSDFAVLAYDPPSGSPLWSARYDAPASGQDAASAIALDPELTMAAVTGASQGNRADLDIATVAYFLALPLAIDVMPGVEPNVIYPYAAGVVQVCILGSETFDVTSLDPTTLRFGPAEAPLAVDLAHPDSQAAPGYSHRSPDINEDGYPDLIVTFQIEATGITCGETEASLSGELRSGRPAVGTDTIETGGCR